MKKTLAFALSMALSLALLAGCGETSTSVPANSGSSAGGAGAGTVYHIGVSQYLQHDALDAAYQGFVDGLEAQGYVIGEDIIIDYENASADQSATNTIASKFVNNRVDMILAIATPSAQAAANATSDIPILITAVTDPADSGLVASNEAPGGNLTGTSDLTPCDEQMQLLTEILPDAETVGIMYTSGEANSLIQYEAAKAAAEERGLKVERFTVSDASEVQQVVNSMVGKVDVIYVPTDNVIAEAMSTVSTIATENGIPCIVGEEGMVNNGGLASWSMSYYQLGLQTADMAIAILVDGADPATMPIQYDENISFVYNAEVYQKLQDAGVNVSIPEEYIALARNEAAG